MEGTRDGGLPGCGDLPEAAREWRPVTRKKYGLDNVKTGGLKCNIFVKEL